MKVKLTKRNVNAYKFGQVYEVESNMANYLINRGLAVEVKPEIKEDKQSYETKEEKHKNRTKSYKAKIK
jgi:ribosomal protein L9